MTIAPLAEAISVNMSTIDYRYPIRCLSRMDGTSPTFLCVHRHAYLSNLSREQERIATQCTAQYFGMSSTTQIYGIDLSHAGASTGQPTRGGKYDSRH